MILTKLGTIAYGFPKRIYLYETSNEKGLLETTVGSLEVLSKEEAIQAAQRVVWHLQDELNRGHHNIIGKRNRERQIATCEATIKAIEEALK